MKQNPMALYKLMILYFSEHLDFAATNAQISEYMLSRNYISYFHIQTALSQLVEDGFLSQQTIRNRTHFEITKEGAEALHLCQEEISLEIRRDMRDYIKEHHHALKNDIATPAEYTLSHGSYLTTMSIVEDNKTIFSVSFDVPTEELANRLCNQWQNVNSDIYSLVLNQFFSSDSEDNTKEEM